MHKWKRLTLGDKDCSDINLIREDGDYFVVSGFQVDGELHQMLKARDARIAKLETIKTHPHKLRDAIQMAIDYILSETTRAPGAGHSRSEVVQALLDALAKVEARE